MYIPIFCRFLFCRSILRREESPAGFVLAPTPPHPLGKPDPPGLLLNLPEENLHGLDLLSGLSPTQARQVQLRYSIQVMRS